MAPELLDICEARDGSRLWTAACAFFAFSRNCLSSSAISDRVSFLCLIMMRTTAASPVLNLVVDSGPDLNCSISGTVSVAILDYCLARPGSWSKPMPFGSGRSLIFLARSSVLKGTTPSGRRLHSSMQITFKIIYMAFWSLFFMKVLWYMHLWTKTCLNCRYCSLDNFDRS